MKADTSQPSKPRLWGALAMALAVFLFMALVCTGLWFRQKFGKVEIDQLLYHLQQGPETVISADHLLVWSGIKNCILGPAIYTLVLMLLLTRAGGRGRRIGRSLSTLPAQATALSGALMLSGYLTLTVAPGDVGGHDWIAMLYSLPAQFGTPVRKKNLILIYAESLEFSFGSHPFDDDLLHPLEVGLLADAKSFPHFRQMAGTGWTIAGMVATQCGIPLKPLGIFGQNKLGQNTTQFLPQAECLGDILKSSGYRNVFLGGASNQFAGKGMFLQTHGYDQVLGREHWLESYPQASLNEWGLNDDDLFAEALKKLAQLSASGAPFNLTILTVGMHDPDGFLAPSCPHDFGDFRDPVACTAHLIADFVASARARGYLEGTDVVILGDHLARPNGVYDKLESAPERSIFNKFLTSAPLPANRDVINHFDIAATLLTSLGYRLPGGRFALGCSALGPVSCKSLVNDPLADAKLEHSSPFYNALWLPADKPATPPRAVTWRATGHAG